MKGNLKTKNIALWLIHIVLLLIFCVLLVVRITIGVSDYVFTHSKDTIVDKGINSIGVWSVAEIPENTNALEISSLESGRKFRENYRAGYSYPHSERCYLFLGDDSLNNETLSEVAKRNIKEIILDVDFPNISPLSDMQSLETLWISSRIEHFSPKFSGNFPNLKSLTICTELDSLGDISKITSLCELDLHYTSQSISDISGIENLTNLEVLKLSSTKVRDITALENLVKMRELYLDYTNVYDISAVRNMKDLEVFSSMQNYYNDEKKPLITDITALENKTKLRKVDLYGAEITDIRPLENDFALEELELSYTDITSVRPLMHLTNLKFIAVYDCDGISSVEMNEFYDWILSLDHEVNTEGVGYVYRVKENGEREKITSENQKEDGLLVGVN